MVKSILPFFILSILFFDQCGDVYGSPESRNFSLNEFQRIDVPVFEVLPIEVWKPGRIKYLRDNMVLMTETFSSEMVVFHDLINGKTKRFPNKGRGPGECLYIRDIMNYGNSIFISSVEDSKKLAFYLDEKRNLSYSNELSYESYCLRAIHYPRERFYVFHCWGDVSFGFGMEKRVLLDLFLRLKGPKMLLTI